MVFEAGNIIFCQHPSCNAAMDMTLLESTALWKRATLGDPASYLEHRVMYVDL